MNTRLTVGLLSVLVSQVATAQDAPPTAHVYEAYYHVNRADMDEWNRIYHEVSVPILSDLVDEGVILGWDQWLHSTGGEYNIRFAIRTADWSSIDVFWSEFLDRRANVRSVTGRIIRDHQDEIWDVVDESNAPGGDATTNYLYASTQQINFANMEEWEGIWTGPVADILGQARERGLLLGWVILGHNTGGPQNSKLLYFFEDWDDIDDAFEFLTDRLEADQSDASEALTRLRGAHDDIVYEPTPAPGD